MRRISWVLLFILCLTAQSAYADNMWSKRDQGAKVYVATPTYHDNEEVKIGS